MVLWACIFGLLGTLSACSAAPSRLSAKTATTVHGSNPVVTTLTPRGPAAPAPPAMILTSLRLTKLAFFDESTGYGLYVEQGQSGCDALVGSTVDGGATFGSLTLVTSWPCSAEASVASLAFDNHGDGFAFGPDLFETHDSGATWAQVPVSGQVLAVEALGFSVWMVEGGCAPSTGPQSPCPLHLFESDNGGRTWTPQATPSGTNGPSPTFNNGFGAASGQTWLLRTSQSAAYLSSNLPFGVPGSLDTDAPLWSTHDGGQTWSSLEVPCGFNAFVVALSAAPDGTLFAVCAGQPGAGNSLKSTLQSTDGGVTWTVTLSCAPSQSGATTQNCDSSPLIAGYLGGIDAVSDTTVYLVGDRSALLATTNGGYTWAPALPLIGDTSDGTETVTFFNPSDGVVLGDDGTSDDVNTIWSTVNGGETWQSLVPTTQGISPGS